MFQTKAEGLYTGTYSLDEEGMDPDNIFTGQGKRILRIAIGLMLGLQLPLEQIPINPVSQKLALFVPERLLD